LDAETLLRKLANGGRIVSSNDLTAMAIADAQACGRMLVDDRGFGYVYVPDSTLRRTTARSDTGRSTATQGITPTAAPPGPGMRDPAPTIGDVAARHLRRHIRKLQEASEMSPAEALEVIDEFQSSISRVRIAMETLVPLLEASGVIETTGEVIVADSLLDELDRLREAQCRGLSLEDYGRLREWMRDPDRKWPPLSFTAGAARDAAFAFLDAQETTDA